MTGFFDTSPATTTQTQQSTSTSNPWAAATPLLQKAIGAYGGYDPSLTSQQQQAGANLWSAAGALPSMLPQATSSVSNIFGNAGMLPAAYQQISGNLSPIAGMSANPYQTPGFSDALNTLTQNITNTVKGQYAASGRSPSGAGAMPQTLARGLMQGEAPVIQSQYNQNLQNILGANQQLGGAAQGISGAENANMMSALQGAGMLPTIGMAPATAQWGAANAIQGQPIQNINELTTPALQLGQAGGTTTASGTATGTQMPSQNMFSNVLGDISSVLGLGGKLMSFSDRRLKTDIKDIGRTHDNQPIYRFKMRGSNVPQIGLMADEVERKTPGAVMPDPATGYKRVDYDEATRKAAKMGMLRAA